jgi:hypothetical protein
MRWLSAQTSWQPGITSASERRNNHQLLRAVDRNKDQSYVLHVLDQEKLARALFPVGDYPKPEIRADRREAWTADRLTQGFAGSLFSGRGGLP